MTVVRSIWLTYHDVYEGELSPAVPRTAAVYHLERERFRRHLEAIRASGLPAVTASDSVAGSGEAAGDHVVITFDDGWEGSLTVGVESLLDARMTATFFVTRDFLGTPRFASRAQLLEAHRAGMAIGTHGATHRLLAELAEVEVAAELGGPKASLEDLLGEPVEAGSVPGGSWSAAVASIARETGYSCLCTSRPGVNRAGDDPLRLRRLTARSGTSGESVERWTRFSIADQLVRHAALQVPRRILGPRRYALLSRRLHGTRAEDDIVVLDRKR